jgi:fructuronate reductase
VNAVALTRAAWGATPAPVRIIHLGLGHFFRAHQAWYTARATDAAEWGIAAFTGRDPRMADRLSTQDGLYALVERGADGDRVEIVDALSECLRGDDLERLAALAADPAVAIITTTVTESGYRLRGDGEPDLADPVLIADLEALRGERLAPVASVLGRLVWAMRARRNAAAGGLAIIPCDNIPGNGPFVRTGVVEFARLVDADLADWIAREISFVSTSVDRITPHVSVDGGVLSEAGWRDSATVVTEPFTDWVLAGDFPAGRPDWESAGARFVDDIEPWEHRKLWLLNGAHSLLTFAGQRRGKSTVADAIADPDCRALVDAFWADAAACLPVGIEHEQYRDQLLDRFANPRIEHRLEQIAADSTAKVHYRFAAVAERAVASGRAPAGVERAIAEWIVWVNEGPTASDARAHELTVATASDDPVEALVRVISPALAGDAAFVARVSGLVAAQYRDGALNVLEHPTNSRAVRPHS